MSSSMVHGTSNHDRVRELLLRFNEPTSLSTMEDQIQTTMLAISKRLDQEGKRLEKLQEGNSIIEQIGIVLQQVKQIVEARVENAEVQEEFTMLEEWEKVVFEGDVEEEPPCDYLDEWTEYIYPKEDDGETM